MDNNGHGIARFFLYSLRHGHPLPAVQQEPFPRAAAYIKTPDSLFDIIAREFSGSGQIHIAIRGKRSIECHGYIAEARYIIF